jgi:hypothetical protein
MAFFSYNALHLDKKHLFQDFPRHFTKKENKWKRRVNRTDQIGRILFRPFPDPRW